MAAGNATIDVSLEFDENGLLKTQAYVPQGNKHLPATIIYKLKFECDDEPSKAVHVRGKKYAVGIDLGTTASAIGVWHKDKVEVIENAEGKFMIKFNSL